MWWRKPKRLFPAGLAAPGGGRLEDDREAVDVISSLAVTAAAPTVESVAALAPLLFGSPKDVASIAALALDAALPRLGCRKLARLDRALRDRSPYLSWPQVRPADVATAGLGSFGAPALLASHPSGYVREAAVEALGGVRDGREIPFLVLRLTDWVKPVRDAAAARLADRVVPASAPHWLAAYPLWDGLTGADDRYGIAAAARAALLKTAEGRRHVWDGLRSLNRDAARSAYELLSRDPGGEVERLVFETLKAADSHLLTRAARLGREALADDAVRRLVRETRGHRIPAVRRERVAAVAERTPEDAATTLVEGALDESRAVRELARFYARKLGVADFAPLYRDALSAAQHPWQMVVAAAGLGEAGGAADAMRVAPLLHHRSARLRAAAVRALGRLDGEAYGDAIVAALRDNSPGVARAARDVLRRKPGVLRVETLCAVLERPGAPAHAARVAIALLGELGSWDRLRVVLPVLEKGGDEATRAAALVALKRWQANAGRYVGRPTAEQVYVVERFVNSAAAAGLPGGMAEDLRRSVENARRQ